LISIFDTANHFFPRPLKLTLKW